MTKMITDTFFKLFRKRGFSDTLEVLNKFPKKEAIQSEFFSSLEKVNSYPNTYFRVKDAMLKYKLIAYKLNDKNDKVIYLTTKGKSLLVKIEQIEKLLEIK